LKDKGVLIFVLLGVAPTAIAFLVHPLLCKYDMNPLCFFKCCIPLILGLAVSVCVSDNDK